ncbi:MAG: MmcQ/YjbR family DNA-binding protein [Clostridia bacterium]|nr:MmcQ/YjbR family DNA-binding protein [Clostridia bacterium]
MICNTEKISYRDDVLEYAHKQYNTQADYPWLSLPEYAVLRHSDNRKWYGIIMNIPNEKLGIAGSGMTDILEIKCDPIISASLTTENGFMPSYHMHRENWISIRLDGSAEKEKIFFFLDMSFNITASHENKRRLAGGREWLIPANPRYYDIEKAFAENDTILWKQSSRVSVGDIIYLYVAAPISAILYKCRAVEVDIPYNYDDENVHMKQVMKIKRLHKFDKQQFNFAKLKEYGVCSIRGPRSVPVRLSNAIKKVCDGK